MDIEKSRETPAESPSELPLFTIHGAIHTFAVLTLIAGVVLFARVLFATIGSASQSALILPATLLIFSAFLWVSTAVLGYLRRLTRHAEANEKAVKDLLAVTHVLADGASHGSQAGHSSRIA